MKTPAPNNQVFVVRVCGACEALAMKTRQGFVDRLAIPIKQQAILKQHNHFCREIRPVRK